MNHHNSLTTVVNLAHYGNVDAAFRWDDPLEKKVPRRLPSCVTPNFDSCDHLNNHIYKDASRIILPKNGTSEKQLNVYVDLQKMCQSKIVEANEILQ